MLVAASVAVTVAPGTTPSGSRTVPERTAFPWPCANAGIAPARTSAPATTNRTQVNRTILIAASLLRVSNVDHGFFAEALQAGLEAGSASASRIADNLRNSDDDRRSRGSLPQMPASGKQIHGVSTSRM